MRTSPLNVQFIITSMPVGGAEVLLLNLIRSLDKSAFTPQVICLKEAGQLGEQLASETTVHSNLLASKWDVSILPRLARLMRTQNTDAVVTVGAGDKMFWGRLAARVAGVPVICSALHSTGWPDGVGKLNRMLTSITSGFIACAKGHAEHLVNYEKFPRERVFMIPNGVNTERFCPNPAMAGWLRNELQVPRSSKTVGIVAALRAEKNHQQFIEAARDVLRHHPDTHFVIVGEGPERAAIEAAIMLNGLGAKIHLLGNRSDTEKILAGLDVFCLTSRNEANPVSILEALACEVPVVAPDVGSISETVIDHQTGRLTQPLSSASTADSITQLLGNPAVRRSMGAHGRGLVQEAWSLAAMVRGYEQLIGNLYNEYSDEKGRPRWQPMPPTQVQPSVLACGPLLKDAAAEDSHAEQNPSTLGASALTPTSATFPRELSVN